MKTTAITIISFLCFILPSNAQEKINEEIKNKNYFYVSPFDLLASTFNMGYERELKNKNNFMIIGGIILASGNNRYSNHQSKTGANTEIQYKINLNNKQNNASSNKICASLTIDSL